MRSIDRNALAVLTVVLLVLGASRAECAVLGGAGRADITPAVAEYDVPLGGYGDRQGKPCEGIHDRIYANALVLKDGANLVCAVATDLLFIPRSLKEEVVKAVGDPEIRYDTLFIAAAHDHAAPESMCMNRRNTLGNKYIGVFNERLLLETAQRIAPAIKEAKENLGPIEMGVASGKIPNLNYNRRRDPVVDDEMVVATFARPGGELVAVFVNFTAHPTITGSRNMLLSGEWPGYMARAVQAQLGAELPVLYMNGPEGDQAPRVAREPGKGVFERIERYGTAVGEKALELLATVTTQPIDRLHLEFASIELPETKLSPVFAMIAGTEYRVKPDELERGLAELIPTQAEVGLLVVGDLLLVGIPGEPIAAIGLEIERRARDLGFRHPVVIGLANDFIGYILTPEEYSQGGYEATVSFFGPDLGTVIVSKTVAALQSL